jgi:IS5 family transposase
VRAYRKIDGDGEPEALFIPLLALASRVRHRDQRQRRPNVSALHAPEVECIGNGKARTPMSSVTSVITPGTPSKGGISALVLFPSLIAGHAATSIRRL